MKWIRIHLVRNCFLSYLLKNIRGFIKHIYKSVSRVLKSFHDRKCAYHLMELLVGRKLLSLFDKFESSDQSQLSSSTEDKVYPCQKEGYR